MTDLKHTLDYVTYYFTQGPVYDVAFGNHEVILGTGFYFQLEITQGHGLQTWTYTRNTFVDFFGSFSSIALGSVSIAAFLMKTHMAFDVNRSMLKLLYWKQDGESAE